MQKNHSRDFIIFTYTFLFVFSLKHFYVKGRKYITTCTTNSHFEIAFNFFVFFLTVNYEIHTLKTLRQ